MCNNLFSISGTLLGLSRHFRLSITILGVFIVGVLVNGFMIVKWELPGVAWGLLLLMCMVGGWTAFLVWYRMGLHPFSPALLRVLGMTLATLGGVAILPPFGVAWVDAAIQLTLVGGAYGWLFFLGGVRKQW